MFRPTEAIPARIGELAGRRGRVPQTKRAVLRQTRAAGSDGRFVLLFSADSAKDRTVANVLRLTVLLQPLGHFTKIDKFDRWSGVRLCPTIQ